MKKDQFPRVPYGSTVHGEEEIEAVAYYVFKNTNNGF